MTTVNKRFVNLAEIPTVPFAMVDERTCAAILGRSVKAVQRDRQLGIGCRFRKLNGRTVRYRLGDIFAFLDSQPQGGGMPFVAGS
jgi:hypothetical protein